MGKTLVAIAVAFGVIGGIYLWILFDESRRTNQDYVNQFENIQPVEPIDLGNGIYYFRAQGFTLTKSLAIFRGKHPDLVPGAMFQIGVIGTTVSMNKIK